MIDLLRGAGFSRYGAVLFVQLNNQTADLAYSARTPCKLPRSQLILNEEQKFGACQTTTYYVYGPCPVWGVPGWAVTLRAQTGHLVVLPVVSITNGGVLA